MITNKMYRFLLESGEGFEKPVIIKSKEDLQHFYFYVGQLEKHNDLNLMKKLVPPEYIKNEEKIDETHISYSFLFPRCRNIAKLLFFKNECYRIAL